MHIVDALFVGSDFVTSVWMSRDADKTLKKFQKKHRTEIPKLLAKVEHWAEGGFVNFEGGEGYPIKHESDGPGVYRLGHKTLFRLLGFYENDDKGLFIIIDAFLKSGESLNSSDKDRIRAVANVKKYRQWQKG